MKTSEFIKKALEIDGAESYVFDRYIKLNSKNGVILAIVDTEETHAFNTKTFGFSSLNLRSKKQLLSLLYEYATTPIEKREEPKKYRLFHKLIEGDYEGYLNFKVDENRLLFSDKNEGKFHKTIFTIKEWEEITDMSWDELLLQFNEEDA